MLKLSLVKNLLRHSLPFISSCTRVCALQKLTQTQPKKVGQTFLQLPLTTHHILWNCTDLERSLLIHYVNFEQSRCMCIASTGVAGYLLRVWKSHLEGTWRERGTREINWYIRLTIQHELRPLIFSHLNINTSFMTSVPVKKSRWPSWEPSVPKSPYGLCGCKATLEEEERWDQLPCKWDRCDASLRRKEHTLLLLRKWNQRKKQKDKTDNAYTHKTTTTNKTIFALFSLSTSSK